MHNAQRSLTPRIPGEPWRHRTAGSSVDPSERQAGLSQIHRRRIILLPSHLQPHHRPSSFPLRSPPPRGITPTTQLLAVVVVGRALDDARRVTQSQSCRSHRLRFWRVQSTNHPSLTCSPTRRNRASSQHFRTLIHISGHRLPLSNQGAAIRPGTYRPTPSLASFSSNYTTFLFAIA